MMVAALTTEPLACLRRRPVTLGRLASASGWVASKTIPASASASQTPSGPQSHASRLPCSAGSSACKLARTKST